MKDIIIFKAQTIYYFIFFCSIYWGVWFSWTEGVERNWEFEFKGSWKAMAIFKTDCAKLLLYNPVFLLLDPKMCIWKHACKCMMISSLSSYFSYYWSFIFPNSDNISASTLFGVFPAFSYFICLYLKNKHKKDGVIFFPWSYFVAPKS